MAPPSQTSHMGDLSACIFVEMLKRKGYRDLNSVLDGEPIVAIFTSGMESGMLCYLKE